MGMAVLPDYDLNTFGGTIAAANTLYSAGQFDSARQLYNAAEYRAPDEIDRATAIRGDAASAWQLGRNGFSDGQRKV